MMPCISFDLMRDIEYNNFGLYYLFFIVLIIISTLLLFDYFYNSSNLFKVNLETSLPFIGLLFFLLIASMTSLYNEYKERKKSNQYYHDYDSIVGKVTNRYNSIKEPFKKNSSTKLTFSVNNQVFTIYEKDIGTKNYEKLFKIEEFMKLQVCYKNNIVVKVQQLDCLEK
ncbi:MAG: hypothetical protein EAZ97_03320 [Bacteroidetes bacterium]|nr:MAG: hypothetical protein EAZ97_03320 [Bacteroidota bacterium]